MEKLIPPRDEEAEENPYDWCDLMGDGVQLRIISEQKKTRPVEQAGVHDQVRVSVKCYASGGSPDSPLFEEKGVAYVVGDAEVPPGMDLGFRFIRKEERGVLRVKSKFGYGGAGLEDKGVGPDMDLEFEVFLEEIKMKIAVRKKELGNAEFKRKEYKKALRLYSAAATMAVEELNTLTDAEGTDEEEKDGLVWGEVRTIAVACTNNVARVLFKMNEWAKARDACVESLKIDGDTVSTYMVCCNICIAMADFEEAEMALAEAFKMIDGEKEGAEHVRLTKMLKRRKAEYKKDRREMGKKMMGGAKKKNDSQEEQSDMNVEAENVQAKGERDVDADERRTMMWWLLSVIGALVVVWIAIRIADGDRSNK
ncbi:hypothetical protein TL16_g01065 [Triparma laevis f. inornata]|uniref:peptidylprolyl isomerase n=1 Tax=Triparma laevis f. inornata TaxID=1714386 RepID=A0A9W6ZII6_9STRA|nr:hypothetical protein TL16_g01065 [Triparma laevis f. inornata]